MSDQYYRFEFTLASRTATTLIAPKKTPISDAKNIYYDTSAEILYLAFAGIFNLFL